MPRHILDEIRRLTRDGSYDVTDHGYDEMADDNLLLVDVETAILTGAIVREDKDDPRGTVHVLEGIAADRTTPVGIAVRFARPDRLLIVTAYKIT